MTTTILLAGLGGLVLLLVLAAVLMPSKSSTGVQALAAPLQPYAAPSVGYADPRPDPDESRWKQAMADWEHRSRQSLRDRELDEDAAAVANEFRRARHERYLASLRTDAAEYFGTAPAAPAKKSAS